MENNCNYSDNWQPYIGDHDKFEYDIKLKDGTTVENCYPNAGKFNSISDKHNTQSFNEADVEEIRFSQRPRFHLNHKYSSAEPDPEYLEREKKKVTAESNKRRIGLTGLTAVIAGLGPLQMTSFKDHYHGRPAPRTIRGTHTQARDNKIDPKIGRNTICSCGSGKKYKHCCINKI